MTEPQRHAARDLHPGYPLHDGNHRSSEIPLRNDYQLDRSTLNEFSYSSSYDSYTWPTFLAIIILNFQRFLFSLAMPQYALRTIVLKPNYSHTPMGRKCWFMNWYCVSVIRSPGKLFKMPHQEVLCQEMRDKVDNCGTQSFRDGCDGPKGRTVVVYGVSLSQHAGARVKTVRNFVCYFSSVNSDWLLVTAVFCFLRNWSAEYFFSRIIPSSICGIDFDSLLMCDSYFQKGNWYCVLCYATLHLVCFSRSGIRSVIINIGTFTSSPPLPSSPSSPSSPSCPSFSSSPSSSSSSCTFYKAG